MNLDDSTTTEQDSTLKLILRIPVCWLLLIILDLGLMAFACAQDAAPQQEPQPAVAESLVEGPADVAANAIHFEAIDVFVDAADHELAAWQLELSCSDPRVEIVGIEGGEHPAFTHPPYYDPEAIRHNRVIIAAFSTDENLPSGRTRIARVHVQLTGPGGRVWQSKLSASATRGGERIPAKLEIAPAKA